MAKLDHAQGALAIIKILRNATRDMIEPASVSIVKQYGRDPFLVLISCLLSLRTRDAVSLAASLRIFGLATTPEKILSIGIPSLQKLIYPVGFYRRKALILHSVCQDLIVRFEGNVPHTDQELRSIKGIGPKTAALVLAEGFAIPAICVDTHVHRISNRLGLVSTKTPEETESALKKIIPQKYWIEYSHLLVMWGQNICVPISPFCSTCPIAPICPKNGVGKRR